MPNNVIANRLNSLHCKLAVTIADTTINATNTKRIYLLGDPTTSHDPTRTINDFDAFEEGEDYLIYPKVDMDLTAWFYPPFPSGEGTGIIAEEGTIIEPE